MSMNQLDAVIEQRAQQRPCSSFPAIFGRHAIYAYNMYIKSAVCYIYLMTKMCVCVCVVTYPSLYTAGLEIRYSISIQKLTITLLLMSN
jgi:hypothetical protein